MSAVEELQRIGFHNAISIERLLQARKGTQAALAGKVMIVDEAGMASGRQMWDLLRLARTTFGSECVEWRHETDPKR